MGPSTFCRSVFAAYVGVRGLWTVWAAGEAAQQIVDAFPDDSAPSYLSNVYSNSSTDGIEL
jgi:hypothetical protein